MVSFLFWFSLVVLIFSAASIFYALSVVRSHRKTLDVLHKANLELNQANLKCAFYELRVGRVIEHLELLRRLNRSGAQKLPQATLTMLTHLIAFLSTPIAGDDSHAAPRDSTNSADGTTK